MISEIVLTIYQQLGGRQFSIITGAKNFCQTAENELSFKIGKNSNAINRIIITYDYGMDVYTIKFCRDRISKTNGFSRKIVAEVNDVFCDTMLDVIEHHTGLATRMPKVIFN